ncbi:MAG TPA: hypothetical protein VMW01_08180 [Williamwhitmania sp.]|jgi:hypothetical protein|nr:hypothetical protein [Williamwhitmania sp.]
MGNAKQFGHLFAKKAADQPYKDYYTAIFAVAHALATERSGNIAL